MRNFQPTDEIVPQVGILVGTGGGFVRQFHDFRLERATAHHLLQYTVPIGSRDPEGIGAINLGVSSSDVLNAQLERLEKAGFFTATGAFPAGDTEDAEDVAMPAICYCVARTETGEFNALVWGLGNTPYDPEIHAVYDEVIASGLQAVQDRFVR